MIDVAVGTADRIRLDVFAVARTLGRGALLRDAVGDRDLEHVSSTIQLNYLKFENLNKEKADGSPAVLDAHLTAAGVNVSVRGTNGFGGLPANLPAVVGGLAVFIRRLDHSLPEKIANSKEKI